jgi:hypothetical protein
MRYYTKGNFPNYGRNLLVFILVQKRKIHHGLILQEQNPNLINKYFTISYDIGVTICSHFLLPVLYEFSQMHWYQLLDCEVQRIEPLLNCLFQLSASFLLRLEQ